MAVVAAAFLASVALAQIAYPIVITKVETKDYKGVPKMTFKRGEVIIVETEITCQPVYYAPKPISYLELITMWYRYTMMGLALTRGAIAPGETKVFGGGIATRVGDPPGTYTFEVYVWNGFPSEMGANWAALAEPKTATVQVIP